jgi:hypothetical protein
MLAQAVGELGEDVRLLGGATVLGRVRAVADADADDLSGIGDDGEVFETVERHRARRPRRVIISSERVVFGERVLERAAAAQTIGERDDAHVGDDTEGKLAAGKVARSPMSYRPRLFWPFLSRLPRRWLRWLLGHGLLKPWARTSSLTPALFAHFPGAPGLDRIGAVTAVRVDLALAEIFDLAAELLRPHQRTRCAQEHRHANDPINETRRAANP